MREKECFVIMPFSDKKNPADNRWDDLFENNLKPAVESANLGYKCIRSADPHGNYMHVIVNYLANAEVVIAVLTELRPNVMYELGVRNALRRRTIMIAQEGSVIPSDLTNFIALSYSIETKQGRDELTKVIHERLTFLDSNEPETDSPVSDYLWKRAQDIRDDWLDKKDPRILLSRITEVLPSYASLLRPVLNQAGQHYYASQKEQDYRTWIPYNDRVLELTRELEARAKTVVAGD
jgi:hypothetical protein